MRATWNFLFSILLINLFIFSMNVYADVNNSGVKIKWSYKGNNGPMRWGQLSPEFLLCAKGKVQSPININKNFKIKNKNDELVIKYQSSFSEIVDDGTTELMIGNMQTIINDGHGIQLNFSAQSSPEIVTYKNKDYKLVQFHIHSPSENQLNGQNFPMEIHFVNQDDDGKVLVIGVFVKASAKNPTFTNIIKNFPKDHGVSHAMNGNKINPYDLIPKKQSYFSFAGSLTTPPCTEGLQWILMTNPIHTSSAQIVLFRKAAGGNNARPIQVRNQRKIIFNEK